MDKLHNILHILGYFWLSVGIWEGIKWIFEKWRMPYRWKCKQCDFQVKTNNRETFEISKSSHNHISTREYK